MNVGELRSVLAELPDNAPLYPDWHDRIPSDSEPGVRLHGFRAVDGEVRVLVSLFYLDEERSHGGDQEDANAND